MILKVLNHKKSENSSAVYDEWTYFDNIESAINYFDEEIKAAVVRCVFQDGGNIAIPIPCVAYLMSDIGKTIEKIYGYTPDAEQTASLENK